MEHGTEDSHPLTTVVFFVCQTDQAGMIEGFHFMLMPKGTHVAPYQLLDYANSLFDSLL